MQLEEALVYHPHMAKEMRESLAKTLGLTVDQVKQKKMKAIKPMRVFHTS